MRPLSTDPKPARRAAFTLVELLVVIAIIGTLVALLLPAVQAARETARGNTCRNNIKQLCTALINYDTTLKELPGLINEMPNQASAKDTNGAFQQGRRVSWIVTVFPYMELTPLYDRWSQDFSLGGAAVDASFTPELANLQCPSDLTETPGAPACAYVGNAGQALGDDSRGVATPAGTSPTNAEFAANGVFFDNNKRSDFNPPGAADGREGALPLRMSMDYMQIDGTSRTMMVSENIHALWYTYPTLGIDAVGGPGGSVTVADAKHLFGFVWSNKPDVMSYTPSGRTYAPELQRVNGARLEPSPESMEFFDEPFGYPSSNHPQGVNFGFADGHVVFISDSISSRVYAQMMTTKHRKSKYFDADISENPSDTQAADRNLPQPSESDI